MENTNNNKQMNEGFSGENLPDGYNPADAKKLNAEQETDENGDQKIVNRARNVESDERNWDENESLSRSAHSIEQNQKTVENKDRNSDVTHDRYPNSHPDNHVDRGNIKLDDE